MLAATRPEAIAEAEKILLVVMPCHTINTDRSGLLQVEESFPQTVFVNVVQQSCEPELAVLAGSFTHAVQSE